MKPLKFLLPFLAYACIQPALAAEEPAFDVELGGYFKAYANYTDQDTIPAADVRDTDILRRTEIHFSAERELDNGTTVGVHVEGIADPGADFVVDESLLYLKGDWGNINFGAKDGAAFLLQVAAPSADKDVDGVRQQIQPVNLTAFGLPVGETDYDQNISAKSDKITYITPLFDGFQAGVSYTPDVGASRGANGNSLDDDETDANSDVVDVAVRYQKKFGDFKVTTGAGYTQAYREIDTGEDTRQAWNTGLTLGYKSFSIGAAYHNDDEASVDNDDVSYTVIGADYKMDKLTFGGSYYVKDDNVGTAIETRRSTVGVSYDFAPGVSFRSSYSHLKSEADSGIDRSADSFILGTQITF